VEVGRDGGVWMGRTVFVLLGGGVRVGGVVGDSRLAQAHNRKRPAPIRMAVVLMASK
jgi:hypothetical protein